MTKKIWMYWHQGWETAPEVVQQCRDSWIIKNPDYEILALDQYSIFQHASFAPEINFSRRDLTLQKISALGRLALLSQHGGIWVDATVICVRPLNEWLDPYYTSRFFAFSNPGPDRLMSNWFIAADPENILTKRLYKSFSDFYANNYFSNQDTRIGKMFIKHFSRYWSSDYQATVKWHSWFARKILRVYPYFIFHYTFNRLILEDQECALAWGRVKSFPAADPHILQKYATFKKNGIEKARSEIENNITPLYKLNWRINPLRPYWAATLEYLKEKR